LIASVTQEIQRFEQANLNHEMTATILIRYQFSLYLINGDGAFTQFLGKRNSNKSAQDTDRLIQYVEIKCQLVATDDFYCGSYCLLNMFRTPLCPPSGA